MFTAYDFLFDDDEEYYTLREGMEQEWQREESKLDTGEEYRDVSQVYADLRVLKCDWQWSDELLKRDTRFVFDDFLYLLQEFQFKRIFKTPERDHLTAAALFLTCRKLAFPIRYCDLQDIFKIEASALCRIYRRAVRKIVRTWKKILLMHPALEDHAVQRHFAGVATSKTGIDSIPVFGFIDSTVREICRPMEGQVSFYDGRKKFHGAKFQGVSVPSGLIVSLYGPYEGRRHDIGMLRDSGLIEWLHTNCKHSDGSLYRVYGDPIHPKSDVVFSTHRQNRLSEEELQFNKTMSSSRASVEWLFGAVTRNFAKDHSWPTTSKVDENVADEYKVSVLLANCLACATGKSAVADHFGCSLPPLRLYLRGEALCGCYV